MHFNAELLSCLINFSSSGRSTERYLNNKIITSQNIYQENSTIKNKITLNNSSYLENLKGFWFWYGIKTTNENKYSASRYVVGYFYGENSRKSVGNGTLIEIGHTPTTYLTGWGFSGSFSITNNQIDISIGAIRDSSYTSYLNLTQDFSFWEMVFFY